VGESRIRDLPITNLFRDAFSPAYAVFLVVFQILQNTLGDLECPAVIMKTLWRLVEPLDQRKL